VQPLKSETFSLYVGNRARHPQDTLHDQFPCRCHHVQTHEQTFGGRFAHHRVKEPPVDLRMALKLL